MAGKSTNIHSADMGLVNLHELYGSTQDQLRQTMARSLDIGDQSLAQQLDDVLIQQKFWEYDIHLKDGALSDLEASDTVASSIIRRYLSEIGSLLSKMDGTMYGTVSALEHDTNHEDMSLIDDINTMMCEKVEIFDAIAPIRNTNAAGSDEQATAVGQLRHHLELKYQKLESQSVKEPQGTLRLLYSPENVQKQAILDVVAVHSFNFEHKAAEQHALDTWRKPAGDSGRLWLSDDLPAAIPQARIFLYEYDSIQAFEKKDHFISTANDLLESIRGIRQEGPCSPCFFITHGLGGFLVLQALVSATSSIIYESIYYSTTGIALFNTPRLSGFDDFGSASTSQEALANVASNLNLPKNVIDTIYDTNLFAGLAEIRQSKILPQVNIVFFISLALRYTWEYHPGELPKFGNFDIVDLETAVSDVNAAPSEICRFDWSEHDQANLDIVCSEIEKLYTTVLEKARFSSQFPISQMRRELKLSEVEESAGEDLGSSSSAKTQTTKAAGSKKPSGQNFGSSLSAKTHNPKASVSKSPSDEELEFHPSDTWKSAY